MLPPMYFWLKKLMLQSVDNVIRAFAPLDARGVFPHFPVHATEASGGDTAQMG